MGPDQHQAPRPRRRESTTSLPEAKWPPEDFVGTVTRPDGQTERWRYGQRIYVVLPRGRELVR